MSVIIFLQKINVTILTVLSLKNTAQEKNGLHCIVKQNKWVKEPDTLDDFSVSGSFFAILFKKGADDKENGQD